jgi:hypothetical protein
VVRLKDDRRLLGDLTAQVRLLAVGGEHVCMRKDAVGTVPLAFVPGSKGNGANAESQTLGGVGP